jgi:hypothetical protein
MIDHVLMDNDVILKICCYDIVDELMGCTVGKLRTAHVLGVARFVLGKAISKAKNIANKERAAERLASLLSRVALIEPDVDELSLAAEFEETAQVRGVALDGGESQLLAVLIRRSAGLLLTGDKRAIRAMEPVVKAGAYGEQVTRRVACLEQIAMALIGRHGVESIHRRICSEVAIDKSLSNCFSCASGFCREESIVEGLASYIADLRRDAPFALVESDDLSTVVAQEDGVG